MTAKEMFEFCKKLIEEGKGDYLLTCEGGCVKLSDPEVIDKFKEVVF